ncbi:hypothetical protein ABIF81_001986 [Bradyrhizobium daqingense]
MNTRGLIGAVLNAFRAAAAAANVLIRFLDMVLIFGDRAIGHADAVGLSLLDHRGDPLRQEHAGLEFIPNGTGPRQKVPGDLVGLLGSGIAIVAEDDVRQDQPKPEGGNRSYPLDA